MPGRCPRSPALVLTLLLPFAGRAAEPAPPPEQVEHFEKKIRPVLVEHCYKCHSADAKKLKGGLLLDTRDGVRSGGDNGPAVVPGKPGESLLVKALRYEEHQMPPGGKLADRVIADFEQWVKAGAIDPRDGTPATVKGPGIDVEAGKKFWSFQPPRRHAVPDGRNPIDAFILARLEQAGLQPAPPADKRTLVRRVTFDLTGLPPTPEEVEAFIKDESPDAYEKLVERLLASPHYGERWARLWLDVARYAEDQAHIVGKDESLFYPNAYRYRDWVIKALNADVHYDRFVKLQLAADLIEPADPADLAALGFIGLGPKYYSRNNPTVMAEEWEDRVDVVTRGLLGLTVACARCHDHKFDPVPTDDYYSLAGVFAGTAMSNRPLDDKCEKKPDGDAKQPKDAMHVVREGKPTDLNVHVRGDVSNKGPVAPRRFLRVLSAGEPEPFTRGSGRLDLAEAIVSRDNPLTARVIVNRVWAQLFGRGLVGTPSDFGQLGERPTHPELLDDLAVRFMEADWSLKWLQRELVLSATYRQSSEARGRKPEADPGNAMLWRMNRKRLSGEAWRDAVLAATGRLDRNVGGTSIDPIDPGERRRTLYSRISRLSLNPFLAMFDHPDPNIHADRRVETTTPLQKLFVLNSPFMARQAEALAERLNADTGGDERAVVQRAYSLLYGRPAADAEVRLGVDFLKAGDDGKARRRQYAHVLLAANEMLYID